MAISNAQKLALYNGALRIIRETKLASITEEREPRRLLDDAWVGLSADAAMPGAIISCLEMGIWHFAKVRTKLVPNGTNATGYRNFYNHPVDYVRLVAMCADSEFNVPVTQYDEAAGKWHAHLDELHVQYVSKHADVGQAPALWPEAFRKVVESYLAKEVALGLTVSDGIRALAADALKDALVWAKTLGAMGQPTRFAPQGSWSTARGGGGQRDGGSRGNLTG